MKFVTVLLFLVTASGFAQEPRLEVDFATSSGEIFAATPKRLRLYAATLVSVARDGGYPILAGGVGTLSFTTPSFGTGTVEYGGTFGPGGEFFISSPYDADISAQFVGGEWRRTALFPDGTYNFILTAQIRGSMFLLGATYNVQGVTVQLSLNTGGGPFLGTNNSSGGNTAVVVEQTGLESFCSLANPRPKTKKKEFSIGSW